MKVFKFYRSSSILLLIAIIFTACHKEISTKADDFTPEIVARVNTWLDKQKKGIQASNANTIQVNSVEKNKVSVNTAKNDNIELLKTNLHYQSAVKADISMKYNYIVIPIDDAVKEMKHIDANAYLTLVLITDKTGNIVSGNIACYLPKDGKPRNSNGAGIMAAIFKGKPPGDSGMLKVMDVTGRRLHEIGFKKGLMSSYGVIKGKNKNTDSSISTNLIDARHCTNWYIVTTYYDHSGNVIGETSEYLGTTCTGCDDSDYENLCGEEGGGGGGGQSETPTYYEEDVSETTEDIGDFSEVGGPSPSGFEPPVKIQCSAKKNMLEIGGVDITYSVSIFPAQIMNPWVEYVSAYGNVVGRDVFFSSQTNSWHVLIQPTVWIQWKALLHEEYVWWGGADINTKPFTFVKIQ